MAGGRLRYRSLSCNPDGLRPLRNCSTGAPSRTTPLKKSSNQGKIRQTSVPRGSGSLAKGEALRLQADRQSAAGETAGGADEAMVAPEAGGERAHGEEKGSGGKNCSDDESQPIGKVAGCG